MRTFQQQVPEAKEGEWWANMELVFDLQLHVGHMRGLVMSGE